MHKSHAAMLFLFFLSGAVIAETEEPAWKGEIGAGFVSTTGNSDTSTISGKVDATHEKVMWRHNINATALNSTSENIRSAEKYYIAGKSDYKFSENYYAFGRVSYENDRFSGFEFQNTLTGGIGRRCLEDIVNMTLDLEAGAGLKTFKPEMLRSETESLVRLSGKYKWDFHENSSFKEELSVEIGEEFTVTKSVAGVSAKLMENFALNVDYTVQHTSKVPAGRKKTDTQTSINLVYSF